MLFTIVQIVSLNIVIDILTGVEDQKTALKNFESYIPKEIWSNNAEKVIGLSNLKKSTTNVVEKLLNQKHASLDQRKLEFLNTIEANFNEYFYEYFSVNLRCLQSKQAENVTLNIVPPFHFKLPPCKENEAYLGNYTYRNYRVVKNEWPSPILSDHFSSNL